MTDNVENLVLEGDVGDLKVRMTMVEEHVGNFIIGVSGVNSRLDLTEAHGG